MPEMTTEYAQKLEQYLRVRDEYWNAREELVTLTPGTPEYRECAQVVLTTAGRRYALASELDILCDFLRR